MTFQTYSARLHFLIWRAAAPPGPSHYPYQATPAGLTPNRFGLLPFRSPLLRESRLLSVPWANKMLQFAHLPPSALFCSGGGDAALPAPSYLIRESPGLSLLAACRNNFVACHALHRLLVPRHPPCAVSSLIAHIGILGYCRFLPYVALRYAVVKVRCYFRT